MEFFTIGFLVLIGTILSSSQPADNVLSEEISIEPEAIAPISDPLFSRTSSFIIEPENSYLTTILNIFYNVPKIQEAFYTEADTILSACQDTKCRKMQVKSSLIVSTAVVFAHMRMSKEPLSLNKFNYEALIDSWARCVMVQFSPLVPIFNEFNEFLTTGITSLYKHRANVVIRNASNDIADDKIQEFYLANFPLISKQCSVESIDKSFYSSNTCHLDSIDTKLAEIQICRCVEIIDTPEVLFFEMSRLNHTPSNDNFQFDSRTFVIDIEITISHRMKYILVGYSTFDETNGQYSSITRDFANLSMYEMSDGKVKGPISGFTTDKFDDKNSVLLVYARSDTLTQFDRDNIKSFADIPFSIKTAWREILSSDNDELLTSLSDTNGNSNTTTNADIDFTVNPNANYNADVDISTNTVDIFSVDVLDQSFGSFLENISDNYGNNFLQNDSLQVNSLAHESNGVTSVNPFCSNVGFSVSSEESLLSLGSNSCISSLIMAFYNIPDLQQAFYDDANRILSSGNGSIAMNVAIAAAFAQMRLKKEKLDANDYLIKGLSKEINYRITANFVILSSFANKILKFLNQSTKKQTQVDCETKIFNAANPILPIDSSRRPTHFVPISVPLSPVSISHLLQNDFVVPSKTKSVNIPKECTFETINVFMSNKIHKSSNYLFMDIERVKYENQNSSSNKLSFDSNPIWINSEIIVDGIEYILVARIEFDAIKIVYLTIIKDFSNSNLYKFSHDGTIQLLQDIKFANFLDSKSTFLIYAKKENFIESYGKEIVIHESIKSFLTLLEEEKQQKMLFKKRKRDEKEQIYKPDYSLFPENVRSVFPALERVILSKKQSNYPVEVLNLMSKFLYGTFVLGSEEYSFANNDNFPCLPLQFLLVQLASSVRFVFTLFEFLSNNPSKSLELNLAFVIVRMLMGCKNIPLHQLLQEIYSKSRKPTYLFESKQKDMVLFNYQIKIIIEAIDASLIALPTVKRIVYPDLNTNDPESVTSLQLIPIKPICIIKPNSKDIRGAWYDSRESLFYSTRLRTIYNSSAVIFPLEISREHGVFFPLEISSMDKNVDGFIYKSKSNHLCCLAFDKFTRKYRGLDMECQSISYDTRAPSFNEFIETEKMHNSIQLFMNSKEDLAQEVKSNAIPKFIIDLIMQQMLLEHRTKLHNK